MAIRDIPEEDSNGCRATSTRVSSSRAIKGHQGPSRAIKGHHLQSHERGLYRASQR